jgi:alpha-glucosidase (family GH31 glycosyl hydrolase)
MDHCPVYVRAGAVIPLAPSSLQYSEQLPGGPLTVQIYAGKNGRFVMVEDDGHSRAYESTDSTRHTTFAWDDSKRLLSWTVQGFFTDSHIFTQLSAVLFVAGGPAGGNSSAVVPIGITGSIQF